MVKNPPANAGIRFDPWVEKIPWKRAWLPTPVFLPGKSRGQRSLAGCSLWGCKELDTTETNTFHYQEVTYHKSLFLIPMGWVVSISLFIFDLLMRSSLVHIYY